MLTLPLNHATIAQFSIYNKAIDLNDTSLLVLIENYVGFREEWKMETSEYKNFKKRYNENPQRVHYPKMVRNDDSFADLIDFT